MPQTAGELSGAFALYHLPLLLKDSFSVGERANLIKWHAPTVLVKRFSMDLIHLSRMASQADEAL